MKPILLDLPMPIITPRLVLRPPQVGDGLILNTAVLESIDILRQFMPWASVKPTVAESEEFVRQAAANWILKNNDEPYLPLFIFDKDNNDFIGATGFHHMDWIIPSIETGYWIRQKYAKQGFMVEAVNAITQYAFKIFNVKRITITCDVDNERSKKIPERLGYHLESVMKSNRVKPISGDVSDTLVYVRTCLDDLPELKVIWG